MLVGERVSSGVFCFRCLVREHNDSAIRESTSSVFWKMRAPQKAHVAVNSKLTSALPQLDVFEA